MSNRKVEGPKRITPEELPEAIRLTVRYYAKLCRGVGKRDPEIRREVLEIMGRALDEGGGSSPQDSWRCRSINPRRAIVRVLEDYGIDHRDPRLQETIIALFRAALDAELGRA